ncbi:Pectinesterase protein [Dioscorea alata]|uniref:Pectinesterase protein n=1 Tax=Dioscorea alata TaxID=55571 RepID=A0ACB7W8B4_DIOAL|nr:Pectinesterase protein [Dioscorea alata]
MASLSILLLLFLLISTTAAATTAVSTTTTTTTSQKSILHSACISTPYPSLCFSSISSNPSLFSSISSNPSHILHISLHLTITAVHLSLTSITNLISHHHHNLHPRELAALQDCHELLDSTLDELHQANTTLTPLTTDLKLLITAAITNQDSCLDGFSHDGADRGIRRLIISGITHVRRMCCNALSMIKPDVNDKFHVEAMHVDQETKVADEEVVVVVVAKDGSGDYRTVGEAVAAAPAKSKKRYVIRIREGRYEENVEVHKKKTNLMFVGDGRDKTVITGSRNVVDGSTTFRSATLAVAGEGFLARSLRIENTAGPSKHQAVALRVNADHAAFYDCDIFGYQDTLYVHSFRQFFKNCTIQGTVDFIFGNAAVVFQNCEIQARLPNHNQKNMITAQSRDDINEPTGIVIQHCRISSTPDLESNKTSIKTFLGRPWKEFSRTVIIKSEIGDLVEPEGWHEWNGEFALKTLFYAEYMNSGVGSSTDDRVKWEGFKVITNETEALQFSVENFIEGGSWLKATGFPYSLGL